jgi:hypothetical protein
MAGFAIRTRFAGHPDRSAKARYALRLKPDHSIGVGHLEVSEWVAFCHVTRLGDRQPPRKNFALTVPTWAMSDCGARR